ncbi:hypothetical protein F5Y00DRAFT_133950 [Daldinia vernicosa]|uniref:uncharacterized protein n=1 Tax=Daldinia vernicosa TaxID=114800 RepID=UPI002007B5F5|nr:uncharacterized protein F5Y00DRAFT_133950 [Daldinia vernicosa]KAI0853174.1 hypothetical protein F5Y00DRAFT_133950 [Daldinia vernicosa]
MDFMALPVELRLSILEMVADSSTESTTEYATIAREWQPIFEKKHFERILLSSRRLDSFAQIVRGSRRKLVKHIWLRAELGVLHHDRGNAGFRPTPSLVDEPNFDNTIVRLLRILSTWERPHDSNKEGLTLELSAWSLRDYEYGFSHQRFMHDPYSEPYKDYRLTPLESHNLMSLSMLEHAFPPEETSSHSSTDLAMKMKGTAPEDIPKVDIVTTFLLRRQYYSHVSSDRIAQIFGSMTGLERIIYEPPERKDGSTDPWQGQRHWLLSDYSFAQTLRQLTIFEDSFHRNAFATSNQTDSTNSPEIAMTLLRESRNLEHLSASFVVDAKDFFRPFWPSTPTSTDRSWNKLKTLALTSNLLNPYQSSAEVNDLLYAAGMAARNMPALRVMEIWNGLRTTHGCFFRYYDDGSTSTITWRGTWELDLEPRVMQCWTETVRKNTRYLNVGFRDMELPIDGTSFPASIIRHLKLKDQIVHPVSFCQLQILGGARRYKYK